MAVDVNCATHSDKRAAGYCSRCQMPYCADCLDVEMGQPLCLSCKKKFSQAASPAASPNSPLNFKGRGLDDDLLGLMGTPAKAPEPNVEAPKAAPPKLDFSLPAPVVPKAEPPKAAPPQLDFSISSLADKVPPASTPSSAPPSLKPSTPPLPMPTPSSAPKPVLDLDAFMQSPQAPSAGPAFPKTQAGPPPLTAAVPLASPLAASAGIPAAPQKKKNKVLSLTKIWAKYLIRRSYEMFDPLAQKLRVPTYVFLAVVFSLIGAAIIGIGAVLNRPSVAMADTIQPIHFVQVNSGQVSEMDVTTYADLQTQVQTMGFTPLIQMTVPQLPSPNFFDVGIKENIGTYSEILKRQSEITPHLSFVTVFTNGVWYSTNGWKGDNQQLEYLVSEFYPKDSPDQLYVKHVQGVEKLKQDKDWQVQSMNQNRYMAALSDHLRWFLDKKGIQSYKANLNLWH